jgi:hypothetical protein
METSGQLHVPATLALGIEHPVTSGQETVWVPEPVSAPAGNRTPVVQPVA